MTKHQNSGTCPRCLEIMSLYPGIHQGLREWFLSFQQAHPEAHVSEAGRGELAQEAAFIRRASKARWGESAHNYNAALDIFEMGGSNARFIYELSWFKKVLAPAVPEWIVWYGAPGSKFTELPHVEVRGWREMAKQGQLVLVEPIFQKVSNG